jgi:hypothetical protein
MTLTEQVYANAVLLSGVDADEQALLLEVLCQSAVSGLSRQLAEGVTPESCKADFIAAASLYALAALQEADPMARVQEVKVGDVNWKQGGTASSAASMRQQAQIMMSPFLKDRFAFRSV